MKSFYLKYRPQIFDEILGQEVAKKILINSLKTNSINHAYLFYGIRGTGKTTIARIFSKALNCQNLVDEHNPCNKCDSCKEINFGSNLDVIEIDAASNNGVDEIREIKNKINYSTTISKYKIYIIDEVHMLTKQAFNALLKTLEEPPKNVIFILATTEINKIPETILSRTIVINISNIDDNKIEELLTSILEKEKILYDKLSIKYLILISEGSMRDAISYLETCLLFNKEFNEENITKALGLISFTDLENILLNPQYFLSFLDNNQINYSLVLKLLIKLIIKKILKQNYQYNDLLDKLIELQLNIYDPNLIRASLYKIFSVNNNINLKKIQKSDLKSEIKDDDDENNQDYWFSQSTQHKSITELITPEHYLTILRNNESERTIKLNDKLEYLTTYGNKQNWKKFIPIILDSEIIASAKKFAIILVSDKNYEKIKRVSLNRQFINFINQLFSEEIYLFPTKNVSLNQMKMYNKKLVKENKNINEKWLDLKVLDNYKLEGLKTIFGNKLEVI